MLKGQTHVGAFANFSVLKKCPCTCTEWELLVYCTHLWVCLSSITVLRWRACSALDKGKYVCVWTHTHVLTRMHTRTCAAHSRTRTPQPCPEQILCQDQHRCFSLYCGKVLAYGYVIFKSKSENQVSLTPNSPHITCAYQVLFSKHWASGLCEALRVPWLCGRCQGKQMPQRNRSPQIASTELKPVTGLPSPQRWQPLPRCLVPSRLLTNPTRSSRSRWKQLISVIKAEATRPFRQKPRVWSVQSPAPGDG